MASDRTRRYLAYRRRRRNGKGMPRWLPALAVLAIIAVVAAGITAGVGYNVYQSYADELVPPDEEIAKLPRGGARILDRDGKFLYEFLDEVSGLRDPVPPEEISLWLVLATIAAEDASFMDNPGVNFSGLTNAAWENFWPFGNTPGFLEGRGGSSITQQLVKNVYFTPEERAERSIERKIKETVYALELTKQYSKEQIMAWYLNQISYGSVFIGVEAASRGYFNKSADQLTLAQSALLAAIPASPSEYDPINEPEAALRQRNLILKRMYDEDYISAEQFWGAAAQPLGVDLQPARVNAPHFVFNVVRPELERLFGEETLNRDGLVVYTSLDLDDQRRAEAILEEHITTWESSGGHNGAAVGIDPNTAEILIYVGSRDYFDEEIDGQNDMADALNSPGSSFKPFTYVTAFMNLGWGPGTQILDSPIPRQFWDAERQPRNPIGHEGPISVRDALGNSLNIPAVKTILYTGVLEVIEQATKMGITSLEPGQLGPSMTVGGVDVKVIDMVYGYTVFPNLGILKGVESTVVRPEGSRELEPISILRVEDRDGNVLYPLVDGEPVDDPKPLEVRVAPAAESYLISNILSDGSAQCLTFGCGGLGIGRPMAIKTGTSEPYAESLAIGDTWAIGYTPQLVFGSWFGNADNSPMQQNVSSTYVSWHTVRDFMRYYHEDLPVESFTVPEGLARAKVCVPSGLRPTDNCPITTEEDLFAAHALPQIDDNWWTMARIDTRSDKLARESTPEEYVEERFFLTLPEGLSEWERIQAEEWAEHLEADTEDVPTEVTEEPDFPIAIGPPQDGGIYVPGPITIGGSANSSHFVSYRLVFGWGLEPTGWAVIYESTSPVSDGTLGTWNAASLPPGDYTIRLVVVDEERGEIHDWIHLTLTPIGPAPTATPGP
jgi:membrane peptidoglycan carboxypeptidase